MLDALCFAWVVTLIAGVVLAVARDVPILEVFSARNTPAGRQAPFLVVAAALVIVAIPRWTCAPLFGINPLITVLAISLAYLWWTMAWRLRSQP